MADSEYLVNISYSLCTVCTIYFMYISFTPPRNWTVLFYHYSLVFNIVKIIGPLTSPQKAFPVLRSVTSLPAPLVALQDTQRVLSYLKADESHVMCMREGSGDEITLVCVTLVGGQETSSQPGNESGY